jgi:hypothetical protein
MALGAGTAKVASNVGAGAGRRSIRGATAPVHAMQRTVIPMSPNAARLSRATQGHRGGSPFRDEVHVMPDAYVHRTRCYDEPMRRAFTACVFVVACAPPRPTTEAVQAHVAMSHALAIAAERLPITLYGTTGARPTLIPGQTLRFVTIVCTKSWTGRAGPFACRGAARGELSTPLRDWAGAHFALTDDAPSPTLLQMATRSPWTAPDGGKDVVVVLRTREERVGRLPRDCSPGEIMCCSGSEPGTGTLWTEQSTVGFHGGAIGSSPMVVDIDAVLALLGRRRRAVYLPYIRVGGAHPTVDDAIPVVTRTRTAAALAYLDRVSEPDPFVRVGLAWDRIVFWIAEQDEAAARVALSTLAETRRGAGAMPSEIARILAESWADLDGLARGQESLDPPVEIAGLVH